jgi:eukaryotic-like serine/threonine-protein kinase
MSIAAGQVLSERYRLIRPVGQGSQASVWVAEHLALSTQVAVKLIDPELAKQEEARERFRHEATAAAQLRSAHVVQILDHGIDGDQPFIVMELLEGEDLFERLERRHCLTLQETSKIVTQVARALTRAHAAGIVHRDLKPENFFLVSNEDDEIVKILDFGVAKVSSSAKRTMRRTTAGALMGTPHYMSPEQVKGLGEVDYRADLWALGVIVYQCVTGELPFDSEGVGDLLIKISLGDIPVPSKVNPDLPSTLDAWFARACDRDPDRRFSSARDLAESLARLAGLSTEAYTDAGLQKASLPALRPAHSRPPASVAPRPVFPSTIPRPPALPRLGLELARGSARPPPPSSLRDRPSLRPGESAFAQPIDKPAAKQPSMPPPRPTERPAPARPTERPAAKQPSMPPPRPTERPAPARPTERPAARPPPPPSKPSSKLSDVPQRPSEKAASRPSHRAAAEPVDEPRGAAGLQLATKEADGALAAADLEELDADLLSTTGDGWSEAQPAPEPEAVEIAPPPARVLTMRPPAPVRAAPQTSESEPSPAAGAEREPHPALSAAPPELRLADSPPRPSSVPRSAGPRLPQPVHLAEEARLQSSAPRQPVPSSTGHDLARISTLPELDAGARRRNLILIFAVALVTLAGVVVIWTVIGSQVHPAGLSEAVPATPTASPEPMPPVPASQSATSGSAAPLQAVDPGRPSSGVVPLPPAPKHTPARKRHKPADNLTIDVPDPPSD